MGDLETLVLMLFNYKFKRCKYCNYYFIPQHNRQVHCKSQHRRWYRDEQKVIRRRKARQQEQLVSFIDGHGKFIKMKSRHLDEVGSMYASLPEHRINDHILEAIEVRKQVKALGLK